MKNLGSKISIFLTTLTLLGAASVFAKEAVIIGGADAPDITGLVTIAENVLEVVITAGIAVFLGMVFVTAYKFAFSQGDPKAMEGARTSLTFTIIGLVVLLLTFSIRGILAGIFGFGSGGVLFGPFEQLRRGLEAFKSFSGVSN